MRTIGLLLLSFFILSIQSCDKALLKGKQSPMGEVGNTFTSGYMPGANNVQGIITDLDNGVSTVMVTAELVNPDLVTLGNALATRWPNEVQMSGSMITANFRARFTDKGISGFSTDDEEFVLCEYDAGVGSSWSVTSEGETATSTITEKTGVDDYYYSNFLIKVSEANIEADAFSLAGLDELNLYFNHRFGFVGVFADFGVNGSNSVNVYSDATN